MISTEQMKQDWSWVGRFVAVIVVALILAAAIGTTHNCTITPSNF